MIGSRVLFLVCFVVTSVKCCGDESKMGLEEKFARSDSVLKIQADSDEDLTNLFVPTVSFQIIDVLKETTDAFNKGDKIKIRLSQMRIFCLWTAGSSTPHLLFIRRTLEDDPIWYEYPFKVVAKQGLYYGGFRSEEDNHTSPEVMINRDDGGRFKRSVQDSDAESSTDVEDVLSVNEDGSSEKDQNSTNSVTSTPFVPRKTLPSPASSIRPASVRTLPPTADPALILSKTLPASRQVDTSTRTLPKVRSLSASPRTLPRAVRVTTTTRNIPLSVLSTTTSSSTEAPTPQPASTTSQRVLPSPRPLPGKRIRVMPSPRSRLSFFSRRVMPTPRRIPISRFRPTMPTSRRIAPRPQRTRPNANVLPARRVTPSRRTLPQPFRNPLPSRRTSVPESGFRPQRVLPTPRRLTIGRFGARVLPTPAQKRVKFIHVSELAQKRDFDGTVIGCPSVTGSFSTTSMSPDGFHGIIEFPPLQESMNNGWMIKMKFNIPLREVSGNALSKVACGRTGREHCLVPNNPSTAIEEETAYSTDIHGNFSGIRISRLRAEVELLGVCSGPAMQVEASNSAGVFRDFNNDRRMQLIEEGDEAIDESAAPLTSQRCLPGAPIGGYAPGGNTHLTYERSSLAGTVDYNELIYKSILFYEAQRSGSLPLENRIPWRGDSNLKDGCSIQADLTGGWQNAGGNVKSTPLIAFSTTLLAWGAIDYREAYMEVGELENVLGQIRWATDYLIKCRTSPNTLVVQIGDTASSGDDWSRVEQSDPESRPIRIADSSNPAADVAGETAAALAAASILFNETDANYADKCLAMARELYQFAQAYPQSYKYDKRDEDFWYGVNHNYKEELAWAAIWLYKATNEERYLADALTLASGLGSGSYLFSMKQKSRAISILLAVETGSNQQLRLADQYVEWFVQRASRNSRRLLYLTSKASNMYSANAAFLALFVARSQGSETERRLVLQYGEEMMGTLVGVRGQGYVVGVGQNPPRQPHHRESMCPLPPNSCSRTIMYRNRNNLHTLYGALVSGIDRRGRYSDRASDHLHNGVRIDYNAGFQGLAAGILQLRNTP